MSILLARTQSTAMEKIMDCSTSIEEIMGCHDMSSIFPMQSIAENHNIDKKEIEKILALVFENKITHDPSSYKLKQWNFENLMNAQISNDNGFVYDWLSRVNNQFNPQTPKQVKEADFKHAKENVKRGRIFTALFPGMQAVEGAKNYLLNTIYAKSLEKLKEIADVQLNIDTKSLNKTRGYKNAMSTGLVGTIIIGAGNLSTSFSKARTIAVIAGIAINAIAVTYATYNYRLHWNDKINGEQELNKVQNLINELLSAYPEELNPQSSKEEQAKKKQAIFKQRGDPAKVYF
jgi:hypothetical protein